MQPFDYLLAIQIPVFRDGDRLFYQTDWHRALSLLRESLGDHINRLKVVAPVLPASGPSSHLLQPADSLDIEAIPSIPLDCRAAAYWVKYRNIWRNDVARAAEGCAIGHFACNDNIRTLDLDAFKVGRAAKLMTVFFRDVDERVRIPQAAQALGRGLTLKERVYLEIDDRAVKYCVRHADLSFLKGRSLISRYGVYSNNVHDIADTSYSLHDVIDSTLVERRTASMKGDRPLRLVYCGRLEPIKGVEAGIRIVAKAREAGANVTFDIIGQGSQRQRLEEVTAELGASEAIRFLGAIAYGPELIRSLAEYDALLFTPTAEETPRMIFDGYAAGLPLIGFDIPYCVERAETDAAAVLMPFSHINKSAAVLANLDKNRHELAVAAQKALKAGRANAVDVWYKRRAELTLETLHKSRP
ncbi:glycosyltransferase [Hyphococcus flavus]|uniref:Glycosyltransferase n=1 Tax=Hyphococcus flavus TaxID=1866326 RepID=A0AAE9ZDK3_9PROT|nr:glycosyltransferase [Hyphococcus flavus]WDI30982.1 glycosyltransferase [Hyphococcus flavus]